MILTNGARLYVDHAHPEYSAPEVTDPMDAVIWDKAGERVMEAAASARGQRARRGQAAALQEQRRRQGCVLRHARELPDVDARRRSRPSSPGSPRSWCPAQVFTGSGRVGIGPSGDEPGFQLSQRADYIEVEVGLETTLKRGIINTRRRTARRCRQVPRACTDKPRVSATMYQTSGSSGRLLSRVLQCFFRIRRDDSASAAGRRAPGLSG